MNSNHYDVIVIGGGIGGATAATHTAQSGYKTLIIDKAIIAGATGSHNRVLVFPAFPEGINGVDLVKRLHRHAEVNGAEFRNGEVNETDLAGTTKKVKTVDGATFESRSVILATGAMDHPQSIQGEKDLLGKGVCYSAILDAPIYKHQVVAVIGKSAEAVEEALYLSRYAEKIYLIIPSNKLELPDALQDRLHKTPRIEPMFSTSIKKINGSNEVSSVTVLSAGQEKDIHVKGVFLYTHKGHPISGFVKDSVKLSESGCVMVNESMTTSAPNVYACGDILCGTVQHPLIVSAQGVIAAMSLDKSLRHS